MGYGAKRARVEDEDEARTERRDAFDAASIVAVSERWSGPELAAREPENLPAWQSLLSSVSLEPWAAELARVVLKDAHGEQFLVVTACLEFLRRPGANSPGEGAQPQSPDGRGVDDEDDADLDVDLEEAGADWLSEQGFERKDRFSGDY